MSEINCGCGSSHTEEGCQCSHKQKHMQRFMDACILVLLSQNKNHGYGLSEHLEDFGFEDINSSTLYRIMRRMDEKGWVSSSWEEGGKGPKRRVYSVTEPGLAALEEWISLFRKRRAFIDLLLKAYEKNSKED